MPIGHDIGHGLEPGRPIVHRIVSPKDAELERARAAGLAVLEGRYSVHKYDGEVSPERLYEIVECPPNGFLTQGVTHIWRLVTGENSTHLDGQNARLAVGDSAATFSAAHTDLQATTNKLRKLVRAAPVVSGNQVTFSAEFTTGEANFAWLEVGVSWAIQSTANSLLSRSAIGSPGLGTKVNTAVWVLNWTLSITSP